MSEQPELKNLRAADKNNFVVTPQSEPLLGHFLAVYELAKEGEEAIESVEGARMVFRSFISLLELPLACYGVHPEGKTPAEVTGEASAGLLDDLQKLISGELS